MQKYSEYVKRHRENSGHVFSKDAGRAMQNNRNLSIRSSAEQKNNRIESQNGKCVDLFDRVESFECRRSTRISL